jgi:hypothetical protein
MYVQYDGGPPTIEMCLTLATDVGTIWDDSLLPYVGTPYTHVDTECIDLSSDSGNVATQVSGNTGAQTGNSMPANIALRMNWEITRRYRGGKPGLYIGCLTVPQSVSPIEWSSVTLAAFDGIGLALIDGINTASIAGWSGQALANVSYYSKAENPTPPYLRTTPVVDVIASHSVLSRISTQRRRGGSH